MRDAYLYQSKQISNLPIVGHLKDPTLLCDEAMLKTCCLKYLGSLVFYFVCLDLSFALRNDDESNNKYF